ncbi:MAG: histidine phosphatase family protein [Lachnospiraceae bacterium]|nr:histidine phosphatase family protein [Lachnospiraceae bacterium]
MRIIFVRHGEPCYEDDSLTAAGLKQADLAAERLRDEGIEEIWSSPLGRALKTAEAASKVLGLPVKTLDFMREISWGSIDDKPVFADGHPWDIADEMARQGIDLNRPDWRNLSYFTGNRVTDCVSFVESETDKWLADYGYVRKGMYYDHTAEEDKHHTVALFCHGGSSSAAIGHILNLPFPYVCAVLHMDFTGITILRMDNSAGAGTLPCLELANDCRHLREIS